MPRPADEDPLDEARMKGIRDMFLGIGENPDRPGLVDTPRRVIRAWRELMAGYHQDPAKLATKFDGEGYDEMICCGPIHFYSMCEHHLLPFFGDAWVAYVPGESKMETTNEPCPNCIKGSEYVSPGCEECDYDGRLKRSVYGKIIGLSKLPRLVGIYARRLQNQERMTKQIVDALSAVIAPRGAACMIRGQHMCMMSRGVSQHKASMTTSKLSGVFTKPEVRAEFFELTKER